ncbi:MAG: hypothetical protein A3J58_00515 [Candidatus Sungbacteria bacterium RIFCSPHIGHO2_02_FULL_52_23]|uniref:Uncharacterized protein n=1 Tax=Candidatus Sungbacteria bacterium RIFCSPHIGHO2_02_FULL_52_23 TaxID=1802274 RepID=A0A1G2KS80_9BACT|nr:MAG: hypothetical protein A3J58_00515 [Candidatus Sungbacteria bacterium RIFCSPHIGHO2_02_FULL_52_23]
MRSGLIGLEERFFEMEKRSGRFIVKFVEIVNKAEIIGMVKKDIAFFYTAITDVVNLVFCKIYFSPRHIPIL